MKQKPQENGFKKEIGLFGGMSVILRHHDRIRYLLPRILRAAKVRLQPGPRPDLLACGRSRVPARRAVLRGAGRIGSQGRRPARLPEQSVPSGARLYVRVHSVDPGQLRLHRCPSQWLSPPRWWTLSRGSHQLHIKLIAIALIVLLTLFNLRGRKGGRPTCRTVFMVAKLLPHLHHHDRRPGPWKPVSGPYAGTGGRSGRIPGHSGLPVSA